MFFCIHSTVVKRQLGTQDILTGQVLYACIHRNMTGLQGLVQDCRFSIQGKITTLVSEVVEFTHNSRFLPFAVRRSKTSVCGLYFSFDCHWAEVESLVVVRSVPSGVGAGLPF